MTAAHLALVLPTLQGGGAERVAVTLAKGLAAGGDRIDIVLAEARGELLAELPPGVRVINLDAHRFRDMLRPLAAYLRRERPDTVAAQMWPVTSWTALAHRIAGSTARLVLTDHVNLTADHAPRGRAHHLAMRATMAATYRRADALTAVSAGVAADVARLAALPRERIAVIHNPIPLPGPAAAADWPGEGLRILSVGILKPQKNHALLLSAFAEVAAQRPARLAIVGDGPLRPALQAQAAALGIADRVRFPGFVTDPGPWYAAADVFALSSDYEGFGNVVAEALGHGLRVVSTDCPDGPAEILGGGRWGRLVPPGDAPALARAIAAATDSPADPAAARARAADFAPGPIVAAYRRAMLGGAA